MKTYHIIQPEVIVGLGDRTEFEEKEPPFRTVKKLHIQLEDWLRDDLMECHPCYIVTESLKEALEKSEFTGFEFSEMEVTKYPYFKGNYQLEKLVPKFYWMKLIGKEDKQDIFLSQDNYLMAQEFLTQYILVNFNHNYLEIDPEEDTEQKALLHKLLERTKNRNS